MERKRVAVLISGRGSNMAALIAAAKDKHYPAEISLVVSNRPDAPGLGHARTQDIATEIIDQADYGKDREGFERALHGVLQRHRIDIVCLAGFMRLLSPWFVEQWQDRMINIHPSLLPAFKGLNTHERVLAAGVKTHGASVHFVVPEVDAGPVLAQEAVAVLDGDTPQTLAARVLEAEHRIYPGALALVATQRVGVAGGHCVIGETAEKATRS